MLGNLLINLKEVRILNLSYSRPTTYVAIEMLYQNPFTIGFILQITSGDGCVGENCLLGGSPSLHVISIVKYS
jgi:hypothetical protein